MVSKQQMTMAEVTRLTRAGRLGEAMAMLRGGDSTAAGENMAEDLARSLGAVKNMASRPIVRGLDSLVARFGGHSLAKSGGSSTADGRTVGALAEGARFDDRVFAGRSGSRTFKLFTPSRYAGQPLPLVVMLHGCQQSPEDFAKGTQMNALAEELGFFVAYPEQTSAANQSRCWNWFVPSDQTREGGEPSLIAGMTRQVMQDVAVNPGQVYIAGLSAGGAAAAIMGSTYPDLYAAVCVHSGLACGAARDMSSAFSAMQGSGSAPVGVLKHPLPVIVFHGDRDHTVNRVNGDQVIAQSMGAGDYEERVTHGQSAGGIAYTRTVHADRTGHPTLEHWVLHGVGHAWSGGSSAGSFTEPRGPDASREMMRFFLEQGPGLPANH